MRKTGFTLIELSIVLVIIGLVVGGVLVGQTLVESAKMRATLSDIDKYNTAALTFKAKYNCLPGDCPFATKLFGAFTNCGTYSLATMGNTTCDGDGDSYVAMGTVGTNYKYNQEPYLFWQQLSLANLVASAYTGMTDGSGNVNPGSNAPKSALDSSCISVAVSNANNSPGFLGPKTPWNANFFAVGNPAAYNGTGVSQQQCNAGLLSMSAIFAKNIDQKIDDGYPFSGNVQIPLQRTGGSYNTSSQPSPGCAVITDYVTFASNSNIYDTSGVTTACQSMVKAGF